MTTMMQQLRRQEALLLLVLLALLSLTHALIDTNGVCSVFVFVPFSLLGSSDSGGLFINNKTNYGFSHMAAALMAADHFNTRNDSVVPELASLGNCSITLELTNSSFFDTGALTKTASQALSEKGQIPCAIAGPFNDYPALELSVMAQASKFPIVCHRAFHPRIVSNFYHRYTQQVYPDLLASSYTLVNYLRSIGRTNYTAFLYSLTDVNVYRRETLSFELDGHNMEWISAVYLNPHADDTSVYFTGRRTPYNALLNIKKSGYKTIVVAMDMGNGELGPIADAAEELGMNNGDYFWVWYDAFDASLLYVGNITKLVSGSARMLPLSSADALASRKMDPFSRAWKTQGQNEVDRLNAANPISPGEPGYKFAEPDFFVNVDYEYGSSFMYDAVISIGMGACQAAMNGSDGKVSGIDHVTGIRQSRFKGASGVVRFGIEEGDEDRNGTRLASTVAWGILNIMPPSPNSEDIQITHVLTPDSNGTWQELLPFVYRDGRTVPPELLRTEPDQNYLSSGLQILGLTLMSIAIVAAIVSAIWVYHHRKHRVLMASQPIFLYLICFGAVIQASAIFTISFDKSNGWSTAQLSSACMATPWLMTLGHTMVYSSLFTKMWRVHRVLQFTRRQIKMSHVAGPMFALVLADLVLLSLWTAFDPLNWQRNEINELTGESIGQCTCKKDVYYALVAVLALIPTVLTGIFAWKTKDVDSAYTESWWIFMMILVQLEVALIAAPIVALLQDVNTNGRYLGFSLLIWTFPMSALGFIMIPKYIAYWRAIRGLDVESHPKRGARESIRVSGVVKRSREGSSTSIRLEESISLALSKPGSEDIQQVSNVDYESRNKEWSHAAKVAANGKDEVPSGSAYTETIDEEQAQESNAATEPVGEKMHSVTILPSKESADKLPSSPLNADPYRIT